MTDTQGGEAAEVVNEAAPQAALSSQAPVERDYEAEARAQGWVPEDEFKGEKRPKKFYSAEEFVERGELVERAVKKTEAKFEDRFKKMERLNGKTIEQLERQHQKEMDDLKAERREAIKAGDADKVEKLDQKIDDLKEAGPDQQLTGKALEKHQEEYKSGWEQANPWFTDDFAMHKHAVEFSQFQLAKHPKMTIEENLAKVDEEMRKRFPDKFEGAPVDGGKGANGHAPVDGGGAFNGGGKPSDPLAKLTAVERAKAKEDMAKFPKIYPNAQAWLTEYNK